jgi:hypothetical protein
MHSGQHSKLLYDDETYSDYVKTTTRPLDYKINKQWASHTTQCMNELGGNTRAGKKNVDIESELTNRNVRASKTKRDGINPQNITRKMDYLGACCQQICQDDMNNQQSRLDYPSGTHRELSINRFYKLPNDMQQHIWWDRPINTQLEARDNFKERMPRPLDQTVAWLEEEERNPRIEKSEYKTHLI